MLYLKDDAWHSYTMPSVKRAMTETIANPRFTEESKGEGREAYALKRLSYLNVKVELVPRNTIADCAAKWDLLIHIGDDIYPLQIKSSQTGRFHYEESTPTLNNREILHAPCLVLEGRLDRAFLGRDMLLAIIEMLAENKATVALNAHAAAAIEFHTRCKKGGIRIFPKAAVKSIPVLTKQAMIDLGLGQEIQGCFQLF